MLGRPASSGQVAVLVVHAPAVRAAGAPELSLDCRRRLWGRDTSMTATIFPLVKQVGRVPSMTVPLDRAQETRFHRLMDEIIMIDLHEHPLVLPEDPNHFRDYLAHGDYCWGYEAVRHGGWTAVCTANVFRAAARSGDMSFIAFADLVDEIALMLADMSRNGDAVLRIERPDDIARAKQRGTVGFLPTVEHLGIGHELHRVDVLYGLGVRIAGITYHRRNAIGDGQGERNDGGLSEFGREVVQRMNDIGMVVDVSHAGFRTAMDAIQYSRAPILFSHNAAYTLRPTQRARKDDELVACARAGGLIAITAVPNSLSDQPHQDINCVLDHYDYLVRLVGVDHVGIGTDMLIGDHVAYHITMMGRGTPAAGQQRPAAYLNGLESPADGANIIRGLIARGYADADIAKIAGQNALSFFRRVMRS